MQRISFVATSWSLHPMGFGCCILVNAYPTVFLTNTNESFMKWFHEYKFPHEECTPGRSKTQLQEKAVFFTPFISWRIFICCWCWRKTWRCKRKADVFLKRRDEKWWGFQSRKSSKLLQKNNWRYLDWFSPPSQKEHPPDSSDLYLPPAKLSRWWFQICFIFNPT